MKRLLVLAPLAAALALPACGAEDLSPDTIANAAEATRDAGGAKVEISMEIEAPDGGDVSFTGEGVMDPARQVGRLTYDLSELPGGAGEMEQVIDRYVTWMRMPALAGELPEGKRWIKVDMRAAAKELYGFDLLSVGGPRGASATQTLEYLRVAGDVEEEGEEELRGVSTTRYSAMVDLRKYPDLLPESERAEAERGIETLIEQTGMSRYPTTVWIGDDDLVRRMRMDMEMSLPGAEDTSLTMDFELFDFGTEVSVEAPPADEVVDVTELGIDAARRQADR